MSTKLIVTNEGALRRKYGKQSVRVDAALGIMAAADRARGIQVRIVRIDVEADCAPFGFRRVRDPQDAFAVKAAVDAVHEALAPAYMMLLGAPDVIPHQSLKKGLLEDEDSSVPSDLPYACDAPASTDARDFAAPTRIVGRLPGITGDDDPRALLEALEVATRWRPRSRRKYGEFFAVAAQVMRESTEESMVKSIGHARDLQVVPPRGYRWPLDLLARRTHFLNCHGIDRESDFQGQRSDEHPLAHSSSYVAGHIAEGTIAAVECCYGAQLYDPRLARSSDPMVNTYLRSGAYGYFGSSTTSYGADVGNAGSDLICQSFLHHVLSGASSGRAALEARLDFLHSQPALDPMVLKTLAQFDLFGDPSIHAVYPSGITRLVRLHTFLARGRAERRARILDRVRTWISTVRTARRALHIKPPPHLEKILLSAMEKAGGLRARIHTFTLQPQRAPGANQAASSTAPDTVHIVTARTANDPTGRPRRVVVVAHMRNGQVVDQRTLHSKGHGRGESPSPG